jgi:hypothetical protein
MPTKTAQSSITITFGNAYAMSYVLGVTSAPPEYDGFQTLTLYDGEIDGKRERYVLIQQRHESWHEGRYRSGLYSYEPSTMYDEDQIAGALYGAMRDAHTPV